MILPLPSTLLGSFNAPKSISYLHNSYNLGGVLVPREPMQQVCTQVDLTSGEGSPSTIDFRSDVYAMFTGRDQRTLYAITKGSGLSRRELIKWDISDGDTNAERVGVLMPNSGFVFDMEHARWAKGFTGVAIAIGGEGANSGNWFFDYSAGTVTQLTDVDLPTSRDVAYLGGRYVWLAYDGETVHFSEVDDAGNVAALSFFDAESNTDKNKALAVIGDDLFVFGRSSIQRFKNVGGATQPFINISNSTIPIGGVGGYIRMSTKVVFIGQEEGGSLGIYEMSGSSISKISSSIIDELLAHTLADYGRDVNDDEVALDEMNNILGQSFASYGQTVYTFTTNKYTLYARQSPSGYQWGFLSSDTDADYSENDEWYKKAIGSSSANFLPQFQFKYATFVNNDWYFANDFGDRTYIAKLTPPTSSETFYDTNADGTVSRINHGLFLGLRDALDRDTVFDSLEVSYSRRVGADYMTQYTGSSGNNLDVTFSLTASDSDWSTPVSIDFAQNSETQRLVYAFGGGITPTNGFIALVVKTDAKVPFVLEKLIANV